MDAPGELPPQTGDKAGSRPGNSIERVNRDLSPPVTESDDPDLSGNNQISHSTQLVAPEDLGYRRPTIDISCPISYGLTVAAKFSYTSSIYNFAVAFDNEISRQELGARGNDEGPVEINADMVKVAYDNVRSAVSTGVSKRGQTRVATSRVWSPIAAAVFGAIAGIFGNNLPAAWAWVFLIVFILAVVVAMAWPEYEVRRRS